MTTVQDRTESIINLSKDYCVPFLDKERISEMIASLSWIYDVNFEMINDCTENKLPMRKKELLKAENHINKLNAIYKELLKIRAKDPLNDPDLKEIRKEDYL